MVGMMVAVVGMMHYINLNDAISSLYTNKVIHVYHVGTGSYYIR